MSGKNSRRGSLIRRSTKKKNTSPQTGNTSMAMRAKRLSREIEKIEKKTIAEEATLEKLREEKKKHEDQQRKIQERCSHNKGFDLIGDEFQCKICKAVRGHAGSYESEEENLETEEEEEVGY